MAKEGPSTGRKSWLPTGQDVIAAKWGGGFSKTNLGLWKNGACVLVERRERRLQEEGKSPSWRLCALNTITTVRPALPPEDLGKERTAQIPSLPQDFWGFSIGCL